jgi:hypothetical protein
VRKGFSSQWTRKTTMKKRANSVVGKSTAEV